MTGKALGGVRRAQMITTYGVGSLIALGSESFMVAGIDHWPDPVPGQEQFIHEPRLEHQLKVHGFRLPPASEEEKRGDVPMVRFPVWHSCPESGVLAEYWKWGRTSGVASCTVHDRELVPSRFVMACVHGHITDFPYKRWVHGGAAYTEACQELKIKSSGRSAALRDIEISCSCGRKRSMDGALSKGALAKIARCPGHYPWLGSDVRAEGCDQVPRAMQRGASGVWFSDVRSAISIPPGSEGVRKLVDRHWKSLGRTRQPRELIEDMGLTEGTPYTVDDILQAVEQRKRIEEGLDEGSERDLKAEEYQALTTVTPERTRTQDFVCVPGAGGSGDPALAIARVMRIERLREVRVLQGFTRIQAPSPADEKKRRAPLYREDHRPDWLPAIEVIGEGIFFDLDRQRLAAWEETQPEVRARAAGIDAAYRRRFEEVGLEPDRRVTPQFLLVHTLSHAIINEWSLDCGYPAASLRERLYVSHTMAGFLIYTATSDSAGSLGGIVALAESTDLFATVRRALDRAAWCSADPLCIESTAGGVDNLNKAACHACLLLPETSCEEYNTLLDRALLVGTPEHPGVALFNAS
jgi:hypothetical protein